MEGIGIYIISSGRPNNVQKMQTQHLPDLDVTWVVSKSQIDAYKSEGANKVLTYGKCAPGKDLSRSRNFALQHTFDQNLVCVQLSDDLNKMSWWVRDAPDSLERRPLSIATAIQFILKQMKLANFFLGGGIVVGLIIQFLTPDGRVRSVSDVIEGAALNDGRVEKKAGIASALCSWITLSTGGSTGREGPVVHIAAMISSWFSGITTAEG